VRTRHAHCGFLEKNILQLFIFSMVFVGFINWVFSGFFQVGNTQKNPLGFLGKIGQSEPCYSLEPAF
jgi:hypothetical protein